MVLIQLGGIGIITFSTVVVTMISKKVGYFTKKWYAESIKTKEEVRKQLLIEFENKGKGIYDVKSYEKLQYNTELVSKWIEKYPNDADKFLRFKEGYETR